MRMRDELGAIYNDQMFAAAYPARGQPAHPPWRLALVTVLQFAAGLPDRQAANAVRGRIDWKYALGLELADPGFDFSILCEFRARLIAGGVEQTLLDATLARFRELGLLKARGQRTDSIHVLAAVRAVNRLESVGETLRAALNALAAAAPDWLVQHADAAWPDRYGRAFEEWRLPKGEAPRKALGEVIGTDGHRLLAAAYDRSAPPWLRDLPAVQVLRRAWVKQFYVEADRVAWRDPGSPGATAPTCRRPACALIARMTRTPASATSAAPPGAAIRPISPRPAMRTARTWWSTLRRRRRRCRTWL